jgi:hypothetical protein
MDTILIAVTALALAMAAGMAIVVATLLRQERARSDARVAALGELAADPLVDRPARRPDAPVLHRPSIAPPMSVPARPASPLAASAPSASTPRPIDDLEIRPAVNGISELFAQTDRPSPWGRRVAVIGCLAAIGLAIGFALVSGTSRPAATPAPTAAQQAPQLDAVPLELLSLGHEQDGQRLAITGLVKNPRAGAPLSHVVATAILFGPDGAFLSSSRSPLDFTTLVPGQESPFVVNIPVSSQVSRYRVGFRTEDGRVIAHVDKRSPDALAQK